MHYNKILLSLNGAVDEKKVIDEAIFLESFFKARLSIVVINDPAAGKAHMLMDTLPRVDREDVQALLHQLGYHDQAEATEIILLESESPVQAIARMSDDFDLLVMGHHAKNRLVAFLKDSTDERVADRIDCPVLLVPLGLR